MALRLAHVQVMLRWISPFWWMALVVQPMVFLLIARLGFPDADPARQTQLMTAVGFSGMWGSVLFTSGWDVERERLTGTLESLVGSPTSLIAVMTVKSVVNMLAGILPFLLSFILGCLAFGWTVEVRQPLLAAAAWSALCLSMASVGLLICVLFAISRGARGYYNFLARLILVAGGFWVPVTALWFPLQMVAWLFPSSWAARASTAAITGDGSGWGFVAVTLGQSAAYAVLAGGLFVLAERVTRRQGSLGLF